MADEYFEYLINLIRFVPVQNNGNITYDNRAVNRIKMLKHLYVNPFHPLLSDDENRVKDALDLRHDYQYQQPESLLPEKNHPFSQPKRCRILELMVALAKRCEDQIMTNTNLGNRTGFWFWSMVESLGLINLLDSNWSSESEEKAQRAIYLFITRKYNQDGKGGLFTIPEIDTNMRSISIWYQAMYYLRTFEE